MNGPAADPNARRHTLLYLARVAEVHRGAHRPLARWAAVVLPSVCGIVGTEWTGRLDRDWLIRELTAVSGEHPAGAYERSRAEGLPLWAALAAGMRPTGRGAERGAARS